MIHSNVPFCILETLREKPRGRAIVLVGIVNIVRVELDLVVVEVEVGSLVEGTIDLGILLLSICKHRKSRFTCRMTKYALSFLYFI